MFNWRVLHRSNACVKTCPMAFIFFTFEVATYESVHLASNFSPVLTIAFCTCAETMCYKQASRILGDINAPPAFASEFPTKEAALRLNSTSSPLHVTAGMIQMRNLTLSGNGIDFSFGKHGQVDIILSFGLSRGDEYNSANSQSKAYSAVSRGWFCFMFIWVMVLSLSFKIGSYICAR